MGTAVQKLFPIERPDHSAACEVRVFIRVVECLEKYAACHALAFSRTERLPLEYLLHDPTNFDVRPVFIYNMEK